MTVADGEGIVHPKMNVMSSFTHPLVNSSAEQEMPVLPIHFYCMDTQPVGITVVVCVSKVNFIPCCKIYRIYRIKAS